MRISAEPRPVRDRLPCFATTAPAAAAMMAAAVETLKVFGAPPVPQVSTALARAWGTRVT
jgi:hypothetical protein